MLEQACTVITLLVGGSGQLRSRLCTTVLLTVVVYEHERKSIFGEYGDVETCTPLKQGLTQALDVVTALPAVQGPTTSELPQPYDGKKKLLRV